MLINAKNASLHGRKMIEMVSGWCLVSFSSFISILQERHLYRKCGECSHVFFVEKSVSFWHNCHLFTILRHTVTTNYQENTNCVI